MYFLYLKYSYDCLIETFVGILSSYTSYNTLFSGMPIIPPPLTSRWSFTAKTLLSLELPKLAT